VVLGLSRLKMNLVYFVQRDPWDALLLCLSSLLKVLSFNDESRNILVQHDP